MKIENIKEIKKIDKGYVIRFDNENIIKLKNKRTILPLLFLLKYSSCSIDDIQSDKYDEVYSIVCDKVDDISILKNDYKDKYKPFAELISEENFYYITKDIKDKKTIYKLNKKDHKLLFEDKSNGYYYNNISKDIIDKIYIKQDGICNMCLSHIDKSDIVIDHIIPLSRGGEDKEDNLQILCKSCYSNKRKTCKNCIDICDDRYCNLTKLNLDKVTQLYLSSIQSKIKANRK